MPKGTVLSVDRDAQTVEAQLTNGQYLPGVKYIDFPPLVGDTAEFVEVTTSRWVCVGTVGDSLRGQDYTPELTASITNPTLGSGSIQSGRWIRVGGFISATVLLRFGTGSSAGSGPYFVSLPVDAFMDASGPYVVGTGYLADSSPLTRYLTVAEAQFSDPARAALYYDAGAPGAVGAALPFAWAGNDEIRVSFFYEAA